MTEPSAHYTQLVRRQACLLEDRLEGAKRKVSVTVDRHDDEAGIGWASEIEVAATHVRNGESSTLQCLNDFFSARPGEAAHATAICTSTSSARSELLCGISRPSFAAAST
jgi:hypothetical protein